MPGTENLKKVFDTNTTNGKLVTLNEEQASTFVDFVRDESKLLKSARFVKMARPVKTIAKLYANGRFLQPGKSGVALDGSKFQQATAETIELTSKMVRGGIFITDEEIQDNIEGGAFTETFMRLVARKVANELEEISIYARNCGGAAPLSTLDEFDGFKWRILQAGNLLAANDTTKFANRSVSKDKFSKMMKVLKTKYRQNIKYLTSSDVAIDYGLLFDTVADSGVRNELRTQIIGKPLVEVPLMRVDEAVATTTTTTVNGAVTANGTTATITFTDASSFIAGDAFIVNNGLISQKVYTVVSKSTDTVTCDRPIEYNIANGATITKATLDGTDAILADPLNFIYGVQTWDGAISFETERVASLGYKYHFKMRMDFQIENPEACTLLTGLKVA